MELDSQFSTPTYTLGSLPSNIPQHQFPTGMSESSSSIPKITEKDQKSAVWDQFCQGTLPSKIPRIPMEKAQFGGQIEDKDGQNVASGEQKAPGNVQKDPPSLGSGVQNAPVLSHSTPPPGDMGLRPPAEVPMGPPLPMSLPNAPHSFDPSHLAYASHVTPPPSQCPSELPLPLSIPMSMPPPLSFPALRASPSSFFGSCAMQREIQNPIDTHKQPGTVVPNSPVEAPLGPPVPTPTENIQNPFQNPNFSHEDPNVQAQNPKSGSKMPSAGHFDPPLPGTGAWVPPMEVELGAPLPGALSNIENEVQIPNFPLGGPEFMEKNAKDGPKMPVSGRFGPPPPGTMVPRPPVDVQAGPPTPGHQTSLKTHTKFQFAHQLDPPCHRKTQKMSQKMPIRGIYSPPSQTMSQDPFAKDPVGPPPPGAPTYTQNPMHTPNFTFHQHVCGPQKITQRAKNPNSGHLDPPSRGIWSKMPPEVSKRPPLCKKALEIQKAMCLTKNWCMRKVFWNHPCLKHPLWIPKMCHNNPQFRNKKWDFHQKAKKTQKQRKKSVNQWIWTKIGRKIHQIRLPMSLQTPGQKPKGPKEGPRKTWERILHQKWTKKMEIPRPNRLITPTFHRKIRLQKRCQTFRQISSNLAIRLSFPTSKLLQKLSKLFHFSTQKSPKKIQLLKLLCNRREFRPQQSPDPTRLQFCRQPA